MRHLVILVKALAVSITLLEKVLLTVRVFGPIRPFPSFVTLVVRKLLLLNMGLKLLMVMLGLVNISKKSKCLVV